MDCRIPNEAGLHEGFSLFFSLLSLYIISYFFELAFCRYIFIFVFRCCCCERHSLMAERDEPYFGTFPCLYCIDNRFIVFSRAAAAAAMLCVRVRRCGYTLENQLLSIEQKRRHTEREKGVRIHNNIVIYTTYRVFVLFFFFFFCLFN